MPFLDIHDHRTQLVLVGVCTALATTSLFTALSGRRRRKLRRHLDESIRSSIIASGTTGVLPSFSEPGLKAKRQYHAQEPVLAESRDVYVYDEDLVREQLARNYAFFGEESMRNVRAASVVVVGCGGVGSWAAVMLARSGVSKIRLIDFDYVTLSSLNRHATAHLADVGTPKVLCVARTLQQIARFVEVDPRITLWRAGEGDDLLEGADWVVDAIDNIQTKVDLLKHCALKGIKVFSSMGAGAKSDPTRVQISDLSATHYDPLARAVRQRLRAALSGKSVTPGIPVVYSTEVPGDVALLPLPEEEFEKGKIDELAAFDDFRVRILPVLGPLPALFGLHIASYIICELAGKPLERPLPVRHRKKLYERLWKDLLHREERIAGYQLGTLPLSHGDIALIFEDISLARTILPPHPTCARPALIRWDPSLPLSIENCVVMEYREAERAVVDVFGVVTEQRSHSGESSGEDSGELVSATSSEVLVEAVDEVLVVDARGDLIPRHTIRHGHRPSSVWGEEVGLVVKKRLAEARRFREWALQ
ncbi:hypothetical protein K488DRAFT_88876 [Vararia minispora EC-137]|uniref:Uncharacterized protein n=1 Tax=Vararia minispora EC-137 TaxID=1314806 RepID=A0ACB8QCK8_9AGAM|nr:hypothetical protein K488DRAFT_88876 [Vararia minispora EC-137]